MTLSTIKLLKHSRKVESTEANCKWINRNPIGKYNWHEWFLIKCPRVSSGTKSLLQQESAHHHVLSSLLLSWLKKRLVASNKKYFSSSKVWVRVSMTEGGTAGLMYVLQFYQSGPLDSCLKLSVLQLCDKSLDVESGMKRWLMAAVRDDMLNIPPSTNESERWVN